MKVGIEGDGVVVRPMGEADAEALVELVGQLGYERGVEDIREWVAGLEKAEDRQGAFVACVGGVVSGWIEVSIVRFLQREAFALIGGLVVKDGCRGMGIGRLLCERVEAWAREHGMVAVRVTSQEKRVDAHRFYVRDGYQRVKTSQVFEKRLDAIVTGR